MNSHPHWHTKKLPTELEIFFFSQYKPLPYLRNDCKLSVINRIKKRDRQPVVSLITAKTKANPINSNNLLNKVKIDAETPVVDTLCS